MIKTVVLSILSATISLTATSALAASYNASTFITQQWQNFATESQHYDAIANKPLNDLKSKTHGSFLSGHHFTTTPPPSYYQAPPLHPTKTQNAIDNQQHLSTHGSSAPALPVGNNNNHSDSSWHYNL